MGCILGHAIPPTVSPAVPCQLAPPVPGSQLSARTTQTRTIQTRPPPPPPISLRWKAASIRNKSLGLKTRRKIPDKPQSMALPVNSHIYIMQPYLLTNYFTVIFRPLPSNASGKVAAIRAISTVSTSSSDTFGKFTSLPELIPAL